MTTDITELAQILKAAAERATPGNWRYIKTTPFMDAEISAANHTRVVNLMAGDVTEENSTFIALANPANVLALVEALEKAQQRITQMESRTVKLPEPHAHLIWIQAGHAPDDYWDDVAVSHSEKDRCCDGSERYPVYARWEIEEMLSAAGIKVEDE